MKRNRKNRIMTTHLEKVSEVEADDTVVEQEIVEEEVTEIEIEVIETPNVISQYNDRDFVIVKHNGQTFPCKYRRAKAMGYKILKKYE